MLNNKDNDIVLFCLLIIWKREKTIVN